MENLIAQLCYAVGNRNRGQGRTGFECIMIDGCYATSDGQGIQRSAVFKSRFTDRADTIADHERFQSRTTNKCLLADSGQRYRSGLVADGDLCQAGAVLECSVVDRRHVCGDGDFVETLTTVESIFADSCQSVSKRDVSQCDTILERRISDGNQSRTERDRFQ